MNEQKPKKGSPHISKVDQVPDIVKAKKEHIREKRRRVVRKTSLFQALELFTT